MAGRIMKKTWTDMKPITVSGLPKEAQKNSG